MVSNPAEIGTYPLEVASEETEEESATREGKGFVYWVTIPALGVPEGGMNSRKEPGLFAKSSYISLGLGLWVSPLPSVSFSESG